MVINIAICGGKAADRRHVKFLLCRYLQTRDILWDTASYGCVKKFLEEGKAFDILFLSAITEKDGMVLNKCLRVKNPWIRVIYLLHPEEAMEIVGTLHAVDHLRKPFSRSDFFEILESSLEYVYHEGKRKKVILQTGADSLYLRPEEIYYIESIKNHKIRIVMKGIAHEIRYALGEAYAQTKKYGFERTHRSYIVNPLHVARITGNSVYHTNGMRTDLAKQKAEAFKAVMEQCRS